MQALPQVILHKGKEVALLRQHPWVFSGAVGKIKGQAQDGDLVEVLDASGQLLGRGHFHDGSIKVRMLTFGEQPVDAHYWTDKLHKALRLRELCTRADTDCFRLVHGEGDQLPGLVIDWYAGVAVVQAHTIGMYRSLDLIRDALVEVFGERLIAIYSKSKETLPEHFARQVDNSYLWGSATVPHLVKENGLLFYVNWEAGQKTGFFLDQRENRALIKAYAEGKTLLNTFAYSGGFSVYALAGSAHEVTSVDISEKAVRLCEQNVALNAYMGQHTPLTEDVMRWLKEHTELYDLVILDPPAFAKSLSAKHRAVQGYKRLNMAGMLRVRSGGLLATFSCSQVVDRELFQHTVVAAALEIGRPARILHQLTQGPDHPVNLFHPEGSYLKGLILQLD